MKKPWFREITPQEANARRKNTMMEHLGIEITRIGEDFIEGSMPVDQRTRQIFGLLHGGASVALAETLGSIGAQMCVDPDRFQCVGIEINANHLRSIRDGSVLGRAAPLHLGGSTQVWDIRITSVETGQLVCVSRLTVAVKETSPN